MTTNPLLSVSSVSFSYGENKILENITFDIREKDFIALIGPNGSGKTTLAKLMLGLIMPSKGKIIRHIPRSKIGYTPQRYIIDKNFPGTVEEILSHYDIAKPDHIGIKDIRKKKFASLSGGQQQRVLIALALQKDPKVLVLDEPTTGVDILAQKAFYSLLKELNEKGLAIILITHEVGVVSTLVKKVLCINHNLCCLGSPEDMPSLLKQMYGDHAIHHHHEEGHHA